MEAKQKTEELKSGMQMTRRYSRGSARSADTRSDGGRQSVTPAAAAAAAGKLVFECQAEFARHLLCCMFRTGVMSDVEVVIDDCCSLRCHTEVLVRVSGYFKTLLQGDPILGPFQALRLEWAPVGAIVSSQSQIQYYAPENARQRL